MVQINEERPRGSRALREACRGRNVSKSTCTGAPEQGSAPAGRDVQVDPAIVVVIAEDRRRGAIAEHDAGARRGLHEAPEHAAKQVARDVQVFGLVIVVVADGQGHAALERRRQAVGECLHAFQPASGRHVPETDIRRHSTRVLGGHRDVLVERQDGIAHQRGAPAAQALEASLVGGGDLHCMMKLFRGRPGLAAGPGHPEGTVEEARGLRRQLWQFTLQRLELGDRIVGGAAREQEVHQLDTGRQVRRGAAHHLAQVALLAPPPLRIG